MQNMFVPTLKTAVAAALLSGAAITAAHAVVPTACDANGDNYISQEEAKACTEQRFKEVSAGQQNLTQEQSGKAFPQSETPEQLFTEADQNGDGKVSQEEWMDHHQQRFTAATEASEGRMPVPDYQSMTEGYVRPTPEQNKQ